MASTRSQDSTTPHNTVHVCRCALLAALALALAAVESFVPLPVPLPGMKLGIANIVTVVAAFWLGPVDTIVVLSVRIVLTAALTGQLATLPFSVVGGGCALLVTLAFARFASPDRLRLCAMAAAVAHNVGQMAVAVALTGTPLIAIYLPPLLIVGVIAGYLTGTLATTILGRVPQPNRALTQKKPGGTPADICRFDSSTVPNASCTTVRLPQTTADPSAGR